MEPLWCSWGQIPVEPGIRGVYTVWMARFLTHVVTFRVSDAEIGKLQALKATFAEQQWGEVMRWLFQQPEVDDLIAKRVGPTDKGQSGIEASLPAGDR